MLVLTRKPGQKIRLNDDVVITVLEFDHRRRSVRVGIQAPETTTIHREEIWQRIQREKEDEKP